MEKKNRTVLLAFLLLAGFCIRVVPAMHTLFGDINAFAEWGMRFWEVGPRNFYTFDGWYYTFPTQPPVASLLFAAISWISDQNVFAFLHNIIKFPAAAAIFFGRVVPKDPFMHTYEYYFFLKLIPIISDLIVSIILYRLIFRVTNDPKKAVGVFVLYLFNPVTIFLSAFWGQIESTVAIFGLLAFLLLYYKKFYLSLPIMFICLYLKPTWAHLLPFYIFTLFSLKPKLKELIRGGIVAITVFVVTTYPFSGMNFIGFTFDTIVNNMLPSAKGTGKLSVSAFNFYTIFWAIDFVFTNFVSKIFSGSSFLVLNLMAIYYYRRIKDRLKGILVGVFVVALGSYLFMDNMLERYFFPAFIPLLTFYYIFPASRKKIIFINSVLFLTLFYSFFRRFYDEVAHPFTNNNYLLIKVLSVIIVASFIGFVREVMVQSKRG